MLNNALIIYYTGTIGILNYLIIINAYYYASHRHYCTGITIN